MPYIRLAAVSYTHLDVYKRQSQSVLKPENMNAPDTITASAGSFDLRDYEVARGQFFSSVGRISVCLLYTSRCV